MGRCNKKPAVCSMDADPHRQPAMWHSDFRLTASRTVEDGIYKPFSPWYYVIIALTKIPSEKAMAPPSSTLAWKIPWTEEPVRLQSMGSLRVGHN